MCCISCLCGEMNPLERLVYMFGIFSSYVCVLACCRCCLLLQCIIPKSNSSLERPPNNKAFLQPKQDLQVEKLLPEHKKYTIPKVQIIDLAYMHKEKLIAKILSCNGF